MNYIKIITINTWKCEGDYDLRMQLMAQQLKELAPGIITCQECFNSTESECDTLRFLAKELNMNAVFLPGRFKKRLFRGNWVDSFSGLGVLSVYPLKEISYLELPKVPGDDDRKMQLVEVQLLHNTYLLIINVHLTHIKNIEGRKAQIEFIADQLSAYQKYPYKIICGDFNAAIDSIELKLLNNASRTIDCYKAGHGAEPRYSLANKYDESKLICVDHILSFEGPSGQYPAFKDSAIVLNKKDLTTGIYPSDHFGISTTLIIN